MTAAERMALPKEGVGLARQVVRRARLSYLEMIHRQLEKALKLALQARLGWLPEVDSSAGILKVETYREVLLELARGAAGTAPLISAADATMCRNSGFLQSDFDALQLVDLDAARAALLTRVPTLFSDLRREISRVAG